MPPGRSVAQICNLLYRRLVVGRASVNPARQGWARRADCKSAIQQITNLRYTQKKAWDCSQASVNQQTGQLLQSLIYLVGARLFEAGRRGRHSRNGVALGERLAARRAGHRVLQIRQDVRRRNRSRIALFGVEGPLLNGAINLSQVADTGVHLRRGAGLYKVGDRDRSQKANNGHYDHDFHQRKAPWTGCSFLHNVVFLFLRRERSDQRLLLVQCMFTYCRSLTAIQTITDEAVKSTSEAV